ncbi:MAG: glycoside hydrolase family 3 N-terminal domain-containing protein [Solirubrobacteraceae bacterium]
MFETAVLTLCLAGVAVAGGCGETSIPTVTDRASNTLATSTPRAAVATAARPSGSATGAGGNGHIRTPPLARMLGQMIVTRFAGTRPSATLLTRIRAGQVGGVILFSDNLAGGPASTRAMTAELQSAATAGGNPPLLIMTDQEGGTVRRLYWAPPSISAAAMGSTATAHAQGQAAGIALHAVGINLDLAPVADVLRVSGSFLGSRSFGVSATVVAERACAFATGLGYAGVGFTLKHFPGLGRALASTDSQAVTISGSAAALRSDYGAYHACGAQPNAIVMISSAAYPSLTGTSLPAVMSPEIYRDELPTATHVQPLTISDDLQTPAVLAHAHPARRGIEAGLDLLMYAQSEAGSITAYRQLLALAQEKAIGSARIREAYEAIALYKQFLLEHGTAAGAGAGASEAIEAGSKSEEAPLAPAEGVGTPTTIKATG